MSRRFKENLLATLVAVGLVLVMLGSTAEPAPAEVVAVPQTQFRAPL